MADEKKAATVPVLNLSKVGRPFDVVVGQDKDGKPIVARILADHRSVEVPEKEAAFLLGKLPNGRARFPELVDASKFSPAAVRNQKELIAENVRLAKENEDLKAKIDALSKKGSDKGNGGSK